jgi:hypothetical protein
MVVIPTPCGRGTPVAAFSLIYPTQRTCLGDIGVIPIYSTAQLDMGIRAGLMEDATMMMSRVMGGPPMPVPQTFYSEDLGNPGNITPDFPVSQTGIVDQYRIAIRATLALLRPSIGVKATKTPVTQVTRNQAEVIAELKQMLSLCTSENVVVGGLTDTDAWLYGFLNFLAKMQGKI